jgi:hypothetical protein
MAEPMVLLPAVTLVVPGMLAYGAGRALKSSWPAVIIGVAAVASALYFLQQAVGARSDDADALNHLLAAFGVSLPAMVSTLFGGALLHAKTR